MLLVATPLASGAPFRLDGDCIDPALLESGLTAFPENMRVIGSQGSSETEVDLAIGFTVEYMQSYKIVNNTATGEVYVLYQCGSVAPSAAEVPEGAKVFAIPLAGVSVPDATALAFIDALGLSGRIDFVTEYAVNPCMQSLGIGGCNQIAFDTSYGLGNAYYDIAANEEKQAEFDAQIAEVDAVFVYGASDNAKGTSVVASPEPGMLQRAEWIKYVSVFFNMEPEANAIFQGLEQRYETIKTAASMSSTKPLVAFIFYTPPEWGEAISVSFADYKLSLIKAAITAAFPDVPFQYGSFYLKNMSTAPAILKTMLANVEVVVDESFENGIKNSDLSMADFMERFGFTADDVTSLAFLRNENVVRQDGVENPAGYTAWFEAAVTNPDGILLDLARVIADSNPEALANIEENTPAGTHSGFLRVLGKSKPTLIEAQQCPLASCVIPSSEICPFIYKACDGSINHADEEVRCSPSCNQDGPADSPPPPSPPPKDDALALRPFALLAVAAMAFAALLC
eukprot:gene7746-921_t